MHGLRVTATHLLPLVEIGGSEKRVVGNEQESGICGILCNELVRKECGPDRE